MAWYDVFKQLSTAVEGEYDRRIRGASNIRDYHPEGHAHGHGHAVTAHDHAQIEEEAGGSGTGGALQGAGGPSADPTQEIRTQH